MPVTVDDIYELRMHQLLYVSRAYNISHWRVSAITGAPPTENMMANQLFQAIANALTPLQTSTLYYYDAQILQVIGAAPLTPSPGNPHPYETTYGRQGVYAPAFSPQGAIVTPPEPTFTAIAVRKYASVVSRYARGSMRLPGVPESDTDVDGNRLLAGRVAAWQAAVNLCYGVPFSGLGPNPLLDSYVLTPCIFSGVLQAWITPTATPAACSTDVISMVVGELVTSQTSRKEPQSV